MSEFQEQPNRSKPEIKSSKHTVAEGMTIDQKSSKESKKAVSKKQLAKRLFASAVIVAGMGISADDVSKGSLIEEPRGVTRELSLQDLEKRAETLYQINLIHPRELQEVISPDPVALVISKYETAGWDKETISALMTSLEKLPPHFYLHSLQKKTITLSRPNLPEGTSEENWVERLEYHYETMLNAIKTQAVLQESSISREEFDKALEKGVFIYEVNTPLEFVLVEASNFEGECICQESFGIRDQVLFRRDIIENPRSKQLFLSTVTHELTHHVAKEEDNEFVRKLFYSGAMLDNVRKDPYRVLEPIVNPDGFEKIQKDFGLDVYNKLRYSSTNTNEFLAVGSEFYLQGEKRFQDVYGAFIGRGKAVKFYDYMRDNIFRGTEYRDYQKINK